jgi:hypothetical protein
MIPSVTAISFFDGRFGTDALPAYVTTPAAPTDGHLFALTTLS